MCDCWSLTFYFFSVYSAETARLLIFISIPGQTAFIFIADVIYNGSTHIDYPFALTYLAVGLIQLMILLYTAHLLTHTMWAMKIDPDNSAIPFLTAIGDLLGSSLLLLGFMFLKSVGEPYTPK